jgi:hypothetical protein
MGSNFDFDSNIISKWTWKRVKDLIFYITGKQLYQV